ncbi:MAG: amino acid aminotransferase [Parvularcula sp.]
MTLFDHLTPRPADALLGLMAAFREDPRTEKVDLGVGVYRNDEGMTPVMAAVRAAEIRIAEAQQTKAYEGPRGNLAFCAEIEKFVLGDMTLPVMSFAAPGGCGALSLATALVKRLNADATAWVSNPTWPNHLHIAKVAGLSTAEYPYAEPADPSVNIGAMLKGLTGARRGDLVIIQGPCHNPTGIDLNEDQWRTVGETCRKAGLLPLIDTAYHGFAISLEEDLKGVRAFLSECPDALISYSCSKNFGLYRERAGALLVTSDNAASLDAVRTHLADIARATYSMPPAHGPAIVATILSSDELRKQWQDELIAMRDRMQALRDALAGALHPRSNAYDPDSIRIQNGMFSQLPFVEGGVDKLRTEKAIYIPGNGRINIAGLKSSDIDMVASELSPYL